MSSFVQAGVHDGTYPRGNHYTSRINGGVAHDYLYLLQIHEVDIACRTALPLLSISPMVCTRRTGQIVCINLYWLPVQYLVVRARMF